MNGKNWHLYKLKQVLVMIFLKYKGGAILMEKVKNLWLNVIEPVNIDRTDTTKITFAVVHLPQCSDCHVSLREFAKYAKKEERKLGLRYEDAPYRPTANGVTLPVEKLDEMIDTLVLIKRSLQN